MDHMSPRVVQHPNELQKPLGVPVGVSQRAVHTQKPGRSRGHEAGERVLRKSVIGGQWGC